MNRLSVQFDDSINAVIDPDIRIHPVQPRMIPTAGTGRVKFSERVFKRPFHLPDALMSDRLNVDASSKRTPLKESTLEIRRLFSKCNPTFIYQPSVKKTVLTNPSAGAGNNGLDNVDSNLICSVNDILDGINTKYIVMNMLGQGTFGQVFQCQNRTTYQLVAIKIIKNKPAYKAQAKIEIKIAHLLNDTFDPEDKKHIVRLLEHFSFNNHLCLVFELLGVNIYDLLKSNQFRGLTLPTIRILTNQILEAMVVLESARVIHCDLKPENILLVTRKKGNHGAVNRETGRQIKLIDFGSACWEGHTMYNYIQSRFYRSPEVLLGLPYDGAIDMWSLGCVCLEMFLGLPIFPGVSDFNQITRIIDLLGYPPDCMLHNGRDTLKYFRIEKTSLWGGYEVERGTFSRFILKNPAEYAAETNTVIPETKSYLRHKNIVDIVNNYPILRRKQAANNSLHQKIVNEEIELRRVFIHFVMGLLSIDPWMRFTPRQALSHPFITGQAAPHDLSTLILPVDVSLLNERRKKHNERLRFKQLQDKIKQDAKKSDATNGYNLHQGGVFNKSMQMESNFDVTPVPGGIPATYNLFYGTPIISYSSEGAYSTGDINNDGYYISPAYQHSVSSYSQSANQLGLDFGFALQRPGLLPGRSGSFYHDTMPSTISASQVPSGSFVGPNGSFLANCGGFSSSPMFPVNASQDHNNAAAGMNGSLPHMRSQMQEPYFQQSPTRNSHQRHLSYNFQQDYGSTAYTGFHRVHDSSPTRSMGRVAGISATSFASDNAEWNPFSMDDESGSTELQSAAYDGTSLNHSMNQKQRRNDFM